MEKIFKLLGVEPTKDEETIKLAYRTQLVHVHPEEAPEEFKALREAYEKAIAWCEGPDEAIEEKIEKEKTIFEVWVEKIGQVYSNIQKRSRKEYWEALFKETICSDIDTQQEALESLLVFLMDNYYLPDEIWGLIDNIFKISSQANQLYEKFPKNFIDFVIQEIETDQYFKFEWFEGPEEGDYDGAIRLLSEMSYYLNKLNMEEAQNALEKLKELELWHPRIELMRVRYGLIRVELDSVSPSIKILEAYKGKDSMIDFWVGRWYWNKGRIEDAYELWQGIIAQNPDHILALKGISDYQLSQKSYEEAKENYLKLNKDILPIDLQEEVDAGIKAANDALLKEYLGQYQESPSNELTLDIALCLIHSNQAEEGLEYLNTLTVNALEDNHRKKYYGLMAKIYIDSKNYEKGIEYLNKQLEEDAKEHKNNRLIIASCYMQLKEYDEVIKWLDEALVQVAEEETNQNYINYILDQKACTLLQQKKYEACITLCDEIIRGTEKYYPAYVYRQEAYLDLGEYQQVLDNFYQAIELYEQGPKPYVLAAKVFIFVRQFEDALDIIKRAKEKVVESIELSLLECRIRRYQCGEDQEEMYQIIQILDELRAAAKEDEKDLEKPYTLDYEKISCLVDIGKMQEALIVVDEALENNQDNSLYIQKAYILNELQQSDEAAQIYEKVLESDPENEFVLYRLGLYHKENNVSPIARHYFEKLKEVNPQHEEVNGELSSIYYEYYKRRGGEKIYKDAVECAQLQLAISEGAAEYYQLARCYLAGYELEKAIENFEKVIELAPDFPGAYAQIGEAHTYQDKLEEAKADFEKVFDYLGDDDESYRSYLYYHLSRINQALGNYQEAILLSKKGLEIDEDGESYRQIAECYAYMQDWKQAIAHYKIAVKKDPEQAYKALIGLAKCYAFDEQYLLATWNYKYAMKKFPNNTYVLNAYADYLKYCREDINKAFKYRKEACELAQKNNDFELEEISRELIAHFAEVGDVKQLETYYQIWISNVKNQHNGIEGWLESKAYRKATLYLIIWVEVARGNIEQAKVYFEQMKQSPRCEGCTWGKCFEEYEAEGLFLALEGDVQKAIEYYGKSVKINSFEYYSRFKQKELMTKGGSK